MLSLPSAVPQWHVSLTCVDCCHRPCDAARAKYALKHAVRTHLGSDDQGYTAMGFGADAEGVQGMYMRKHVIEMAQRGLVENLKRLQPLMTPTAAKVRYQCNSSWLSLCQMWGDLLQGCGHDGIPLPGGTSEHLQPSVTFPAAHGKC